MFNYMSKHTVYLKFFLYNKLYLKKGGEQEMCNCRCGSCCKTIQKVIVKKPIQVKRNCPPYNCALVVQPVQFIPRRKSCR